MSDRAEQLIGETLGQLAAEVAPEGKSAVCTNWVLIAEWSDTDGGHWISRWWDEGRPVWQRDGMLYHALFDWPQGEDGDD